MIWLELKTVNYQKIYEIYFIIREYEYSSDDE